MSSFDEKLEFNEVRVKYVFKTGTVIHFPYE